MIRLGEDVVVEEDQPAREHGRGQEGRADDPQQIDSVRAHGGDLVVLRQPAEGRQGRDQNGARHGEGQHPSHGQSEELQHDPGRDALPDGQVHQVEQEIQGEQEYHDAEADQEREEMLAQDISFEYSHMALPFNTFQPEPPPDPGVYIFT